MKKLITGLAAVLAFGFYGSVNSAKSIEIEVAYPYSGLFDVTFQAIMPEFEKAHPENQVKLVDLLIQFAIQKDNKVLVTTHSPLLANAVNNYIYLDVLKNE